MPIVLAAVTLGLFRVPRREFFETAKDPSTLTDEELEELLQTEQGRKLKTELIDSLRREEVPDTAIPELIVKTVKEVLNETWGLYTSLTDKSMLADRFDKMFMSDSFVEQNGRPLAEAYSNFMKMYFIPLAATAPAPEVQARVNEIVELTREAGPDTGISSLNVLLQSIKDEKVRKMLQDYSTHMLTYYTTGMPIYKVAAERSLNAVETHIQELQKKVEEETTRASNMVKEYDTNNEDIDKLRKQLRSIRQEGPKLQDQYETQKRINDNAPILDTKYWVKLGIVAGLFAIAFVARTFSGGPSGYIFKSVLIAGLAGVGFGVYKLFLG